MRVIPPALQTHLDSGVTTLCRLLKITLADGRVFGLTTLDRSVDYQDVTYHGQNGFDPSVIATDTRFDVDNAEGYALYAVEVPGISVAMAQRGELDGASWHLYLVNYRDLTMGHVLLDAGDLGEVRSRHDTIFIPELLSHMQRLRQSIGHVDSLTCRAVFGTEAASQTGCGVNAEDLWQGHSVTAVSGEEPHLTFVTAVINGLAPPARVRWRAGDNVSARLYQVESIELINGNSQITLLEPLPFPIQVGDTLDIRPDCDKLFTTCRDRYRNQINFKGENLIPVGQASDTPGSGLPGR